MFFKKKKIKSPKNDDFINTHEVKYDHKESDFYTSVLLENVRSSNFPLIILSYIDNHRYDTITFHIGCGGIIEPYKHEIKTLNFDQKSLLPVVYCIRNNDFMNGSVSSGFILTDSQFDQIEQYKQFFLVNGYLPQVTIAEIEKKNKQLDYLQNKFQVLITRNFGDENDFLCSDYTDFDTANKWLDHILGLIDEHKPFMEVNKVKENLPTRLNIIPSIVTEIEVIRSTEYINHNFTPYWRLDIKCK